MTKVKIIKDYKEYKKGDYADVTPNIAFGLVDSGIAITVKVVTANDYKTKEIKRLKRG